MKNHVKLCIGCGYCCIKAPCHVAQRLYPGAKYCPQLEWQNNRYICKLMQIPGKLGENYREELHAGAGCCSPLNLWRSDVQKRESQLQRTCINPLPETMQIFIKCLSNEFISNDKIKLILISMNHQMKKSGYSQDEIELISKNILYTFHENRHSFMKDFMG